MSKITRGKRQAKRAARTSRRPGSTAVDRRLLAQANLEDTEARPKPGGLSETVRMTREELLSMSRQIDDVIGFVIDAKTPSLVRTQMGLPPTDWALMTLRDLQHSIIRHAASSATKGAT
jgi:hypothetical protein